MPDLPQGILALPKGDQRAGEILHVGHRMRNVGVAEHLGRLVGDRPREDPIAYRGKAHVAAEEVRAAPDRRADPSVPVRLEQRVGDVGSDSTVWTVGPLWQVLGQRTIHRSVGVQVVTEDERGSCGSRRFDDRLHERWMQRRPLRVRRVGAVVDHGSAVACALRLVRLGEVRGDDLDGLREVGPTARAHHSDPVSPRLEVTSHRKAEWTGAEDNVEVPVPVHLMLYSSPPLRA